MQKSSKRTHTTQGLDKGICQFYHAKKRARERVGFNLTEARCELLKRYIKEGKSDDEITVKFIRKDSNRISRFNISVRGFDPFQALFDRDRDTFITFLPIDETISMTHYIDIFGNKVSLRDSYGDDWRLTDGNLNVPCEEVKVVGPKEWEVGFLGGSKIFILKNDMLFEKGPFGTY